MKKTPLSIFIILLLPSIYLKAQNPSVDVSVLSVLKNAQNRIKEADAYSCRFVYRYSNESTPSIVLDSLKGMVESSKGKHFIQLGDIETIQNDSIAISIFNEDKILFLSKPNDSTQHSDPLIALENAIKKSPSLTGSTRVTATDTIVELKFPDNSLYKIISISVSRQNHLINKVVYLVKTEALTENGSIDADTKKKYDDYARVEAVFTDIKSAASEELFDQSKYFKKQEGKFLPVGKYSSYQIVIGSSNL